MELKYKKQISSDTLVELAEIVLKNNIFEFDEKTFKQVRGTAIGTKFVPLYAILFNLFILFMLKCYFSQCFLGETYDMVAVYRRHIFCLGKWRRVRAQEILRAQEHSRKDLLERKATETSEQKLTFNII